MTAGPDGSDAVARWLTSPSGTSLAEIWPAETAQESFDLFYAAILRHHRVDPTAALAAVRHLAPTVRKTLTLRDQHRVTRLLAHSLAFTGAFEESAEHYAEAWAGFRAIGARDELGATGIGWIQPLSQLARYEEGRRVARATRRVIPASDGIRHARLDANQANIAYFSGRTRESVDLYRRSRTRLKRVGYHNDAALVANNLGHAWIAEGRLTEARRCFEDVVETSHEQGWAMLSLYARAGVAIVDLLQGRWPDAWKSFEAVEQELDQLKDPRAQAHIHAQQAEFLFAAGALERAEHLANRAHRTYRSLGLQTDLARTAYLHARVLGSMNRILDARARILQATAIWEEQGNRVACRRAEVELAGLLVRRNAFPEAAVLLRGTLRPLDRRDPDTAARARHLLAHTHLAARRFVRAARLAEAAHRGARNFPVRFDRPSMALTVARAHLGGGKRDLALRWIRRCVEDLETLYLRLGTRVMRGQGTASRTDIYRGAVGVVLEAGGAGAERRAVDLLTRARSPQLVEDMLGEPSTWSSSSRAQLSRLREELLGSPTSEPDDARHARLRQRVRTLDREMSQRKEPMPAVVTRALAARRLSQWAARLHGRALVLYSRDRSGWSAFVVESSRSVRRVSLPGAQQAVDTYWTRLRLLFEQAAHLPRTRRTRFLQQTKDEALGELRGLSERLWTPLALRHDNLVLVAEPGLEELPLESLIPDSACMTRVPHPALLATTATTRARRALLLHDGREAGRSEARGIARLLRSRGYQVATGSRARNLTDGSERLGLVHVAAHGTFDRERWFLNGIRLADGWLGFEQLPRRRVAGSLLVFSSCESGLPGVQDGAELGGWMGAGLGAGARGLVLTLWKIDDHTASEFAKAFYPRWVSGEPLAQAIAAARMQVRRDHPHPYHWGGFLGVGD